MSNSYFAFMKEAVSAIDNTFAAITDKIEWTIFTGGEVNVKLSQRQQDELQNPDDDNVYLIAHIANASGIMVLLNIVDAIRQYQPAARISLLLTYVPYGRQDRVCNPGESFSLRVFARLINSLHLHRVGIVDPHSDVTGALIENSKILDVPLPRELQSSSNPIAFVSPDLGAIKRTERVARQAQSFGAEVLPIVYASKTRARDNSSLAIEIVKNAESLQHGKPTRIWVVDDICDGGRTFIGIAEEIMRFKSPSTELNLFVTHGIFSHGTDKLEKVYDRVVSTFDWERNPIGWPYTLSMFKQLVDQ